MAPPRPGRGPLGPARPRAYLVGMTALDRLPFSETGGQRFPDLYRMLGALIFRPWFDSLALRSVAEWYFPLSRGWAAAVAADGDLERFLAALPPDRALNRRVLPALERIAARARTYQAAAAAWEAGFFAAAGHGASRFFALEQERHRAAHRHMSSRLALLPFKRHLPPVRWEVAPPAEVEQRHGPRLAAPATAYAAPALPEINESARLPTEYGQDQWLRFRSPVLGDTAWARVHAPRDLRDPPSVLFLHGIAMETEMWAGTAGVVEPLVGRGLRVIAPEGPWHGRRRAEGFYGGEPVFARGPLGLLDLFQAWIAEVAVLIDWARRTSGGPVVLAGVSLGALTAQLAACASRRWPAALRPDLLFLVATSGALLEIASHGSLSRALGLPAAVLAQGWDDVELGRWLPLLQPDREAPLDPERIIMVLGRVDDLTPFDGGRALAETWAVPADNLFLRDQGHFSVSLGLFPEPEPLERLAALLRESRFPKSRLQGQGPGL